ncbi:phage major tail tube protein [Magnetofaba australis]|uniref:Putative Phage tail tube protein n=1 Tax=Magnetofaba australis IT-1 TaxID=1434232 RepID=A0A1Y2K3B8_9PROT|nr:phage major tail tube protein [Magnetofaba australis]OSM01654.1 putative Phage tail tube protein [Magnetofaba australis IT-1]
MIAKDVLRNMNLFVDGHGHAGNVVEITLPKLALKTEEHRAGGMDAPIAIDMGMEKMETSFTLSGYNKEVLKLFGLAPGNAKPITIRGALKSEDSDAVVAVVVQLNGTFREVEADAWKPGDKSNLKVTMDVRKYVYTQGGEEIHNIDVVNMTRIINKVDQLKGMRDAIMGKS